MLCRYAQTYAKASVYRLHKHNKCMRPAKSSTGFAPFPRTLLKELKTSSPAGRLYDAFSDCGTARCIGAYRSLLHRVCDIACDTPVRVSERPRNTRKRHCVRSGPTRSLSKSGRSALDNTDSRHFEIGSLDLNARLPSPLLCVARPPFTQPESPSVDLAGGVSAIP